LSDQTPPSDEPEKKREMSDKGSDSGAVQSRTQLSPRLFGFDKQDYSTSAMFVGRYRTKHDKFCDITRMEGIKIQR
ncbi:hypothetical protein NDU88_006381, partial [Pleurodeles waltl]